MNFDLAQGIAVLERTPATLRALLADLPQDWTSRNEGKDSWSPFDVVGHLIDGEETDWMPRARIILAQGKSRTFEKFDRFRHLSTNERASLAELLDRFEQLRQGNLKALRALKLDAAKLALKGEHPELGAVTLSQLLATWVVHDLGHIGQIARVMSRQYADAVGPWNRKDYLPVLHR